MISKPSTLALAVASLFVITGTAFADHFQFSSPGGVVWNGVYVNPYTAIADQPGGYFAKGTVLTVYCDDWNTDFSGYPGWTGTIHDLDDPTNRYGDPSIPHYNMAYDSGTKKLNAAGLSGTPTPANRYLEAAWLDWQWEKEVALHPSSPSTDVQKRLAAAVWTLFVDTSHLSGLLSAINNTPAAPVPFALDVYNYLQAAEKALLPVSAGGEAFTGEGWDVLVAGRTDAGGQMQEFLVHETAVPEPGSIILLGGVAGFLALKLRRRRQR